MAIETECTNGYLLGEIPAWECALAERKVRALEAFARQARMLANADAVVSMPWASTGVVSGGD
jgi:uncharacterized protein YbjQ (UPF0145 family)